MNRVSSRQMVLTFVPSLGILAVVLLVNSLFEIPMPAITGDIAGTAGISPFTGFLSNLGVLLWCASASVCFFAATLLPRAEPSSTFWFILASALLSTYLLLDDLFLIHDYVADRYFRLPEAMSYATLGATVVVYVIVFRRDISRTYYPLLLVSLGFFAVSVLVDTFHMYMGVSDRVTWFLEDGAKWLGIACWCSYYLRTCHQLVVSSAREPSRGPEVLTERADA